MKTNRTDFRQLSNLINQLEINYKCFQYLHNSFETKRKELNDLEYYTFEMRREVCYLRLCYWNHFSEIVNILYTFFLPSRKKEEISFINLDEDLKNDSDYNNILSYYNSLNLKNTRNRTTAHKSADTLHSFFHTVQRNINNESYLKVCKVVDSFLQWAFNKYVGKLAIIVNSGNMLSGLRIVYRNIENNQTLDDLLQEDTRRFNFENVLFDRILKISISSSVLRNQTRKKNIDDKILEGIRQHLKILINLRAIKSIKDENTFQKFLNSWTQNLVKKFKGNNLKWGSARKALNVMLEELYLSYYMKKYVKNISNYLEIPLDNIVYKKLKEFDSSLPDKFTISALSKKQSELYQETAKKLAKTFDLKRVELDVMLWTSN